jgi:hypothetical protein
MSILGGADICTSGASLWGIKWSDIELFDYISGLANAALNKELSFPPYTNLLPKRHTLRGSAKTHVIVPNV